MKKSGPDDFRKRWPSSLASPPERRVILSEVTASQREAVAQSKDPYLHKMQVRGIFRAAPKTRPSRRCCADHRGSFDCIFPFASEWKDFAQDDNYSDDSIIAPASAATGLRSGAT